MKERIVCLDTAKVIAAFLVVYTHLFTSDDPFRLWVYTFHMPLFFLISGFFHKKKTVSQTILDNIYRLIIPAFFFILLGIIVYTCIYGLNEICLCVVGSLKGIVFGRNIPANNVIWFLFVLFWDNILLNTALRNKWFFFVLPFLYMVSLCSYFKFLHFAQAMFSLPFYSLGYFFRLYIVDEQLFNKHNKYYAIVGGAFLFMSIGLTQINSDVSMHLCHPGNADGWYRYLLFYLNGLVGSLFVICISKCLPSVYMENISKGLISILGGQFFFMLVYDEYVGRNQNMIFSLIVAVFIMVICIKMHYLLAKYAPFCIGIKKK